MLARSRVVCLIVLVALLIETAALAGYNGRRTRGAALRAPGEVNAVNCAIDEIAAMARTARNAYNRRILERISSCLRRMMRGNPRRICRETLPRARRT